EKQSAFINAIAKAADGSANGAAIRYSSSNEKIATVSRNGKIAATGTGVAVISVITADGFEKSINVTVGSVTESAYETNLGLRLYYFDEAANSYNYTEVATDRVAVKADGEYTLTIDADKDLNDIAKKALADANGNACIN
ncbi:Ig-like domain-containing protein, partial [Komagataeibacter oboediens]|nr:Ig-like domain-containing protein [Komagataeibacter oboediens]